MADSSRLTEKESATSRAIEHETRWMKLLDRFLPFEIADTFWRASRHTRPGEPEQGWKLHISATVLQACDLFELVAPVLRSYDLRFKAPNSLRNLIALNAGPEYGYRQVGKFLTVYPPTDEIAVTLARELHTMTAPFACVRVPFDNQYRPESNVFYRYGTFSGSRNQESTGIGRADITDSSGNLVQDDPLVAVPDWLTDPFRDSSASITTVDREMSPLETDYRVFEAITQRGKGGTYRAIDLTTEPPRLCILKEGRRHGEVDWLGNDGIDLAEQESRTLLAMSDSFSRCPKFYRSFQANGNFYFTMEDIGGVSLQSLMMKRRHRFSIKQVLEYGSAVARLLEELNQAGWVWNDCKPANLIVTPNGEMRPVDFENAYRLGETAKFEWSTRGYSDESQTGRDTYALGAVMYVLLAGRFYDPKSPTPIHRHRRSIPKALTKLVTSLLTGDEVSIGNAAMQLEEIASSL